MKQAHHPLRYSLQSKCHLAPFVRQHIDLNPSVNDSLPSRELIKEAADAFFLHYAEEGVFTFVHRPTLIKSIETDTATPESLLCLLAVAGR